MAIREPYRPVTDPTERLIQIRGVKKRQNIKPLSTDHVEMRVPLAIQEFFAKLLNHIGHRSDWFSTCITCKYWNGEKEICNKFGIRPPACVMVDGCEYYEDNDTVPF
jgi:hypothetical protein